MRLEEVWLIGLFCFMDIVFCVVLSGIMDSTRWRLPCILHWLGFHFLVLFILLYRLHCYSLIARPLVVHHALYLYCIAFPYRFMGFLWYWLRILSLLAVMKPPKAKNLLCVHIFMDTPAYFHPNYTLEPPEEHHVVRS